MLEVEYTLNTLANKTKVIDGPEGIRTGILALWRYQKASTRKLALMSGLPVPGISALRNELLKLGLLKNLHEFSDQGEKWIKSTLNLTVEHELPLFYDSSSSSSILNKYFSEECLNEIKIASKKRPHPNNALDQSRINFSTIIKRIQVLLFNGDLEGRNICLLGDDDGLAIALAIFRKYNPQFKYFLSVLDIDELILKFIRKFDQDKTIKIKKHDLREGIPLEWENKFDIIMTDPPYTINGARLFLRTAYHLLRHKITENNVQCYNKPVYFCFSQKASKTTAKLMQMVLSERYYVETIYKRFNFYTGERLIHQFGNLWILKSIPSDLLNFPLLGIDIEKIYTWQMVKGGVPHQMRNKH